MTKTILITGCSSGIGYDAAHGLKRAGWKVFATCRREEDCERLRDEGLISFPLDMADPASIEPPHESSTPPAAMRAMPVTVRRPRFSPKIERATRAVRTHSRLVRSEAVEAGVHVVGASSLAAGHLTLVPELKSELARLGRPDIMVVVGGVIPPEDFQALRDMGVSAIFTPGSPVPEAAIEVIERLNEQLGYAQVERA